MLFRVRLPRCLGPSYRSDWLTTIFRLQTVAISRQQIDLRRRLAAPLFHPVNRSPMALLNDRLTDRSRRGVWSS